MTKGNHRHTNSGGAVNVFTFKEKAKPKGPKIAMGGSG
jgi:hypothetical protein